MGTETADWDLFRYLLAVEREGTLSGAARTLGVSQPTVGRQIAALEAKLGTVLFTRSGEGLRATSTAVALLAHAEDMESAAAALARAASGDAHSDVGVVRLTASEIVAVEVLPPALARFRATHPRIDIELYVSNRTENLLRRDVDIAVRNVKPTAGAIAAVKLGTVSLGLYAHRDYLARKPAPMRIADLADHDLIGWDRDAYGREILASRGIPVDRDRFAFRTDSDLAKLAALRAGCGLAVCQVPIARRTPDLVAVLEREVAFEMPLWLARHEDLRGSRRVGALFEHLTTELKVYANEGW